MPQGRHGHGLLASGLAGLKALFPDLERELVAAGAVPGDVTGNVRWFQHGHFKARFTSGLDAILLSRPLLESCVRRRVQRLPNVSIVDNTRVSGLVSDRGRVHGVRIRRPGESESTVVGNLVIDASGRGSHTPQWLAEMGYAKPATDEVSVGIGYTTRLFRRLPGDLDGDRGIIIAPTPPTEMRIGFMLAMEGDRWIVGTRRMARQSRAVGARRVRRVRAVAAAAGDLRRAPPRRAARRSRDVRLPVERAPAIRGAEAFPARPARPRRRDLQRQSDLRTRHEPGRDAGARAA